MTETGPVFSLGTFATAAGQAFPAMLIGDTVLDVQAACDLVEMRNDRLVATMIDLFDRWSELLPVLRRAARLLADNPAVGRSAAGLRVLAPVRPRQILCVGANYRRHVIELMAAHEAGATSGASVDQRREDATRIMDHRVAHGQPYAFVKPCSAVLDPFEDLIIPADVSELDWELELGVVIGRPARRVPRDRALEYVAGYVIVNDITARDHIARPDFPSLGLDYVAGKSGPGFLPLGPYILPAHLVPDPQDFAMRLTLNGETMQQESTRDMIFPVDRIVEFLSVHMQLLPGDVIATGSPAGNGAHHARFLRPGDVLEGAIVGLGAQRNRCTAERPPAGAALHRPFAALARA